MTGVVSVDSEILQLYLYLERHRIQCLVSTPMIVQLHWEPCTCKDTVSSSQQQGGLHFGDVGGSTDHYVKPQGNEWTTQPTHGSVITSVFT